MKDKSPQELVIQPVPEELRNITPQPPTTDPAALYAPSSSHAGSARRRTGVVPLWFKYLFATVLGTITFGMPALLIRITQNRQAYVPILSRWFDMRLAEVYRWSLLFAATYCAYYSTLTVISTLPLIVEGICRVMRKDILTQARVSSLMQQVTLIKNNFALFAASLALWISTTMLFADVAPETKMLISNRLSEFYFIQTAFTLVILSGLLAIEKLLIQRIAVVYHSDYYANRIKRNMFAISAVQRLKKKYPFGGRPHLVLSSNEGVDDREQIHEFAESLFRGLCSTAQDRDYLVMDDFCKALTLTDAQHFFSILDTDNNGDVTLLEFEEFLQNLYNERDLLSQCLESNDQLVSRLDGLGVAVVLAVTAALCLPIFNISWATGIFTSVASLITVRAFFESSILSIFDTIIFIFVSHPFDAGDVVLLDGSKYKVKHIGWWQSSFYGDGNTLVYLANNTLNGMRICNYRRSGPQAEEIVLEVHPTTTTHQIERLEEALTDFARKNHRDFLSPATINVNQIVNKECLKLTLKVTHRSNFQQGTIKFKRSCLIAQSLRTILKDLKITLAGGREPFSPGVQS